MIRALKNLSLLGNRTNDGLKGRAPLLVAELICFDFFDCPH